ncbi:MAG: radical SAM protein [Armatimonadia bacterium]
MRVLLVDPPCQRFMGFYRFYFPLGLAYLAGYLQERGHEVVIYDADHAPSEEAFSPSFREATELDERYRSALTNDQDPIWAEYTSVLEDFAPDVVGISVLPVKVPAALKMAAMAKQSRPGVVVVVGGHHPTARPADLVTSPFVDYAVRGEGEEIMADLLEGLGTPGFNPAHVPGLSWSTGAALEHTPDRRPPQNLDAIPRPAREALIGVESYRPVDLGLMMTSRGCPYQCTFCGVEAMSGLGVRWHSVAQVVAEMQHLYETYGCTYFSIRDNTFTLSRKRTLDFCESLSRALPPVSWECLTRCDVLDDELVAAMQQAGCDTVRLGIESGSPTILRSMNKHLDLEAVRRAASILRGHGLHWAAYFMLGVPEETVETIRETMDLIEQIDPPFVTLARFTPLPGTAMYDETVAAGLLSPDEQDWTWGLNQSVGRCFSKHLTQPEFETIMGDVSILVEQHNARHCASHQDRRLVARPQGAVPATV